MIAIRSLFLCGALGALPLAQGCGQLRSASAAPAPMEGQLAGTLQQAEREALASRFGVADGLLIDFAEKHPDAPESVEVGFWRALIKLDPANQTVGAREAIALLDAYLASSRVIAHRGVATSLRRVAVAAERPAAGVTATPAPSGGGAVARAEQREDRANAEEVQRLKEELAKANAELERIKRRLAQPTP